MADERKEGFYVIQESGRWIVTAQLINEDGSMNLQRQGPFESEELAQAAADQCNIDYVNDIRRTEYTMRGATIDQVTVALIEKLADGKPDLYDTLVTTRQQVQEDWPLETDTRQEWMTFRHWLKVGSGDGLPTMNPPAMTVMATSTPSSQTAFSLYTNLLFFGLQNCYIDDVREAAAALESINVTFTAEQKTTINTAATTLHLPAIWI